MRTENVASISIKNFSEISEKVEKSVSRRIEETETNQTEILKMIEKLSSKIETLSDRVPGTAVSETNEINSENRNEPNKDKTINLNENYQKEDYHSC